MRKHIEMYYKSYDGINKNELERKIEEHFNEFGYNFESNKKRSTNLDETVNKTGPYCLQRSVFMEKG